MAKDLYVRVKPKSPVNEFHRCGLLFGLLWVFLAGLDDATAGRLQEEQMLETSEEKPEGFDEQEATAAEDAVEEQIPTYGADGLFGSLILPTTVRFEGDFAIEIFDLVHSAVAATHLSAAGWNALPQSDREQILQTHAEDLNAAQAAGNQANAAQLSHNNELATLQAKVTSLTNDLSTATSTLSSVASERDILKGKVTELEAALNAAKAKPPAAKAGTKAKGTE